MDTIYATAPFWAWVNPSLLSLLLQPTIRYHRITLGANGATNYVVDDIGQSYPQATGPSPSSVSTPKSLESTSDMMIITSALIRASGDSSIVTSNVSMFHGVVDEHSITFFQADLYKTWGEYLKDHALYPGTQFV